MHRFFHPLTDWPFCELHQLSRGLGRYHLQYVRTNTNALSSPDLSLYLCSYATSWVRWSCSSLPCCWENTGWDPTSSTSAPSCWSSTETTASFCCWVRDTSTETDTLWQTTAYHLPWAWPVCMCVWSSDPLPLRKPQLPVKWEREMLYTTF